MLRQCLSKLSSHGFKHGLRHGSRSRHGLRHNSTIPALVAYIKNPGIFVPFAEHVLQGNEIHQYNLFRTIKLGNCQKLEKLLEETPSTQAEKETLVSTIRDLKSQPYSVPNFLIGYAYLSISQWIFMLNVNAWNSIYHADVNKLKNLSDINLSDANLETIEQIYNTSISTMGIYPAIGLGIASLIPIGGLSYYGLRTIYDEFRSPYYSYDKMIRVVKKTLSVEEIAEQNNEKNNKEIDEENNEKYNDDNQHYQGFPNSF